MVVVSSDLEYRFSGGAANLIPNASLGGIMSANDITSATVQNLFDNVTAAEAAAGDVEYRCLYVINTNVADTIEDVSFWIEAQTSSVDTSLSVGLDPAGVGDGSTTGVATTILDEQTAPAGVSFTEPVDFATGLAVGSLATGEAHAIWLRRTVTAGASVTPIDDTVLKFRGIAV